MKCAWLVKGLAIASIVAFGFMVIGKTTDAPSLGDWGSFLQALAATLAFIWLVYGQYENQKASCENQKNLADQMAVTRELVAALSRIASGSSIQADEVLRRAEPIFEHIESSGMNVSRVSPRRLPRVATWLSATPAERHTSCLRSLRLPDWTSALNHLDGASHRGPSI